MDHTPSFQRLHISHYHSRPGTAPGILEDLENASGQKQPPARVSMVRYGPRGVTQALDETTLNACRPPTDGARNPDEVTWIHLQGQPSLSQLKILETDFNLHPLALEDVHYREGRPKRVNYGTQTFVVLNTLHADATGRLRAQQLSFFLEKNVLISIDEGLENPFKLVRRRIAAAGKICSYGADYLFYALLDAVVDCGFPILEALGNTLEHLEDEILDDPKPTERNRIHFLKRDLLLMRHAWWPQREVIAALMRDDEQVLSSTTRLYLRDCYDHCVILMDFIESYRETASNLLDIYLSAVSQRMNDIMKVLTVIATIFLPLTFITGLYGMNFDTSSPWNLPELHWRFGYLYALGLMIIIAAGMIMAFRRKGWL